MNAPEFARPVPLDRLGTAPLTLAIAAEAQERAALCQRFDWLALDRLEAKARLVRKADGVEATGQLRAVVTQACAVTRDPIPSEIDLPFAVRFVDASQLTEAEDEIELGESDLDVIHFTGQAVDLGEAAAQTLALALDPFPRSPGADDALPAADGPTGGAFAGLKDLLKRD